MGIAISGLASNLDTESIIANLMKLERAPRLRMELREGQAKARGEALREVLSTLRGVSEAAAALQSAGLWADVQTVQSSDPGSVSARQLAGIGPGGYQVEVIQLARAEQRTYDFAPSEAASTITIDGRAVELGANATLADAVAAINADPETGVFAVAVGERLVLSSRLSGAENGFVASGATIAEDAAKAKPGLDASYKVDGAAGSSASNVLTGAIPGLELTLNAVTAGVSIAVGPPGLDREAVKGKLKEFVSRYNAAVDALHSRLSERPAPNATSQADANKGVLFGDTALSGLLGRMRQAVSEAGLANIGLSTGAPSSTVTATSDSVVGRLTLDEAKLTAALESEPTTVQSLLQGSEGLAQSLEGLLAPVIGVDGSMSARLEAVSAESDRIEEDMAALDQRLEEREERLHTQFATLERVLSESKSQAQWLSGQLASL